MNEIDMMAQGEGVRAMGERSISETTGNEDDLKEASLNSRLDGSEALIIGGVGPGKEHSVELGLGCPGMGLWFRCEGALLWDSYGSLMRSVLMAVHRYSSLRDIYVVAEAYPPGSEEGATARNHPVRMGAGISADTMRTMNYLLRDVYGVDPEQWLGSRSDPASAVLNSVRLLREHPLMPESICVQGFLIEETGTRLLPLHA